MLTVVCGFFGMFQILYLNVDNYLLSLVINRLFDNDNYCMFVNPVYSISDDKYFSELWRTALWIFNHIFTGSEFQPVF